LTASSEAADAAAEAMGGGAAGGEGFEARRVWFGWERNLGRAIWGRKEAALMRGRGKETSWKLRRRGAPAPACWFSWEAGLQPLELQEDGTVGLGML
jgi:hypothetical protein